MRILFVENHAVFAQTVASTFLSSHSVEVVPTVAAALAAAETHEYDVALVDYDLDDGKGDVFVARLREKGTHMVVVGVSSHAAGNEALIQAGADHVCAKADFAGIAMVLTRLTGRSD